MNCKTWETYKFHEVTLNLDKKRIPLAGSQRTYRQGKYPYYGAQGIIDYIDDYIFDGTYLLIAEDGENLRSKKQSIATLAKGRFWVNNHAHIICNSQRTDIIFLYYLINSMDLSGYITGSAQPKLSQANLNNIALVLPPLPEQRAIAATLSSLDDKIELNNRMNKTLEEMAQAIFKSWFVDFEPFQDGEFVDSELGRIPKGWRVGTVSDCVALITRGITPRYTNSSNQLVINQKCIRNHEVSLQQARTHSSPVTGLKELVYGDVLINSTGQGTLGRSAQWFEHFNNITVDSHVTIVRAVNLETAYYIGQCIMCREQEIEDMATGSTGQTELAPKSLLSMKIIIPCQVMLQQFENAIKSITQKIVINAHEQQRLIQLRDSLLPKLMNGEIRVPINP